ncbi:MAG: hypothetical protein ACW96M_06380 [Candidatus Thorarchaeota archaeon]|jgi:hypothetical protein
MSESLISRLKVVSIFIFLGFLMTLGMVATTFLNPGGGNLYEVRPIANVIADLLTATPFDITIKLASLIFDNFFMIGYLAIFYGLYLITKGKDELFAKIGFLLGSVTFVTDLIENAFQIALLTGVPNGWVPADNVFSSLWVFMYVKDISSYMAGFVFIVMLLVSLNLPRDFREEKMILVILLGLYVVLGIIAIIDPSLLVYRNLSFMIDLLVASVLFRKMASDLG